MWIKTEINGPDTTPSSPPRDPNFRAEFSLLKSDIEDYGVLGTRRIDVYEIRKLERSASMTSKWGGAD